MSNYPKRLIEVDLPIKKISAHARREKSIRHGHISTLHIWWARRPLAACRAVLCAALWPDPADPLCPQKFRDDACRLINGFATKAASDKVLAQRCSHDAWKKWQALAKTDGGLDALKETHWNVLRFALLDFIADFADWDNSSVPDYLEISRALTQSAHEALGGAPGTQPLVMDPFAGGGSIPLEALRIGAHPFATDLNPIPVLLNRVVLDYIPRHGQRLADEVREWGAWIKHEGEKELARYFPKDEDGASPIAYLWARTVRCEGPGCGVEIPLVRAPWLVKKARRSLALQFVPNPSAKRIDFRIIVKDHQNWVDQSEPKTRVANPTFDGTVKRGAATCPCCGYTTPNESVRRQLQARFGGANDARLLAVVTAKEGDSERKYRLANQADIAAVAAARGELSRQAANHGLGISLVPDEELPAMSGVFNAPLYGHATWGSLFTSRQALTLVTLARLVKEVGRRLHATCAPDLALAVQTCLAFAVDRQADYLSCLCTWHYHNREKINHTFARQALPFIWDFAETVFSGTGSGNWSGLLDWTIMALEGGAPGQTPGEVEKAPAQRSPLPDDSAQAFATDPPYYNAVPYADLSDFFYVWLRRTVGDQYPGLFDGPLSPKDSEICEMAGWDPVRYGYKTGAWFEARMKEALAEGHRVLMPSGLGIVVFAHKTTSGWEALLQAMIDAGWTVTGSWPIDTEMGTRLRAHDSAALASSVHLVCRPRKTVAGSTSDDEVGDWRDILAELPPRIHEWMPRLHAEGVVGADAIFACLGPALEIFSRYSRVERPDGGQVTLKDYMEYVWAAVSKEAISMIFAGADTSGFEEDARLTAMWLWTLGPGPSNGEAADTGDTEDTENDSDEKPAKAMKTSGFTLEYDAARKIAQGLGAHLEQLINLVEVKGETARLLPVAERTQALFGKEGTDSPAVKRKKSPQLSIPGLFEELEGEEGGWTLQSATKPGGTTLDRLHQAMILFAAGRGEALRRFLVDEGAGKDQRFWRLAQSLCALYPSGTDERRWSEGVLARKKGLGL